VLAVESTFEVLALSLRPISSKVLVLVLVLEAKVHVLVLVLDSQVVILVLVNLSNKIFKVLVLVLDPQVLVLVLVLVTEVLVNITEKLLTYQACYITQVELELCSTRGTRGSGNSGFVREVMVEL